jgi:tetratricopeptide (TPR) repeat protein
LSREFVDFGLSPAQERVAAVIDAAAEEVASEGRGRVLFVGAEPGAGLSHVLSSVGGELRGRGYRVGTGRLSSPASEEDGSGLAAQTGALATGALSLAAALDPRFSLVASVAGVSAAAADILRTARGTEQPGELVTRVLRAAAVEAPDRPLVCLVDDAAWLGGTWWTELQFSFAKEVVERLPLLLVLAVREGAGPDAADADLPSSRVEESLVGRGLADSLTMDALSSEELGKWLRLKPREAVRGVFELTRGQTGEIAELCEGWLAQGALEHEKGGLLLEDPDVLVDGAATDLAARLDRVRGAEARANEDLLREALAFGALEGRTFTAEAVALALRQDVDLVEDLFDELVAETPEAGVLLPPLLIEVEDRPGNEPRDLWRFEFANRSLWRAAQHRLSDVPTHEAATRMLEALVEVFGGENPGNLPSLARLAELSGASPKAAHYRSLITSPGQATLKAQADLLIAADRVGWAETDYRDAAYVMADAATELEDPSVARRLEYARVGVSYAEAAGQIGRHALAKVYSAEARALAWGNRYADAEAKLREAQEIVKQGSPELLASILCQLAEVLRETEAPIEARRPLLEKALRLYHGPRSAQGEARVLWNLANIAAKDERDLTRARELNGRALEIMRAAGNEGSEIVMTGLQANIELLAGNLDLARELLDRALRYETATGKERGRASNTILLARVELAAENYQEAWDLGRAALARVRELEMTAAEARVLHVLGDIAIGLDEPDEARTLLEAAEVILREEEWIGQLRTVEEKLRDLSTRQA